MEEGIKEKFNRIDKKLEINKQEIKIGSFDTTTLAVIFFLIALYIGLVATINHLNMSPYALIGLLYFGILIMVSLFVVFPYVGSIINDKNRFRIKADNLTYIF